MGNTKATIGINSHTEKQTPESPYTHWTISDERLIEITQQALEAGNYEQGYREGVLCVNVDPTDFYTGLVELQEGDKLVGSYVPRVPGETPRTSVRVQRENASKVPCKAVQVILYAHDVLAEDNDAEHETDFEIITANGYPTEEVAPIEPNTLLHNHFGSDGGTATNLSPEKLEEMLRASFKYWSNKALLAGE
jgi:hypothetical protein